MSLRVVILPFSFFNSNIHPSRNTIRERKEKKQKDRKILKNFPLIYYEKYRDNLYVIKNCLKDIYFLSTSFFE